MSKNSDHRNSSDIDALAVKMLEISARADLSSFLNLFRKDYAKKIDFGKSYELLDDELPYYVPEEQLKMPKAFTLFVRATSTGGRPMRFLMHVIWIDDLKFAVGIAEVPDNVIRGVHFNPNWN